MVIVLCERESPIAPLLPDVRDIPTAGLAPGVYLLPARTEDQQAAQLRVAVLR